MRITAATPVFAVLGDPIAHSLSPLMHNGWIADHGIDAVYVALRVAQLEGIERLGLAGANVTIPHKEAAARLATSATAAVQALGAANTLRFDGSGGVHADNTDAPGLCRALDEAAPHWRPTTQVALVLGAGGAAAGAVWAFKEAGVPRVVVINRTHARAEALAQRLGVEALAWTSLPTAFAEADLIVNATSAGLADAPAADWPFASAKPGAIAFDMVYKPLHTAFLAAAEAQGLRPVDGLGMLVHQGGLAFESWFGVQPDTALARARLLEALKEAAR